MKKLLNYLLVLAVILIISGCERKATRPYPTKVIYREVVNDNDSQIVLRESCYTLDSVKYDTIYRKNTNNVVPPTNEHRFSIPDDKVDLNDYFNDPNRETDFNYTELSPKEWRELSKLGIYWDDSYGCYRKKK